MFPLPTFSREQKGQSAIGPIIMMALIVIVGTSLLPVITNNAGNITKNTVTDITNESVTLLNGTAVALANGPLNTWTSLINDVNGTLALDTEYTVNETSNPITVTLTNNSRNNTGANATYIYVSSPRVSNDTGTNAIIDLLPLFVALGIMLSVLLGSKVNDL